MNRKKFRNYGTDPEFFMFSAEKNSLPNIIPPAALIADYKAQFTTNKNKKRVLLDSFQYSWIEDGAAIELNLKKPFNDSGDLYNIMNTAVTTLRDFIYRINHPAGIKFSRSILGYFDLENYWKNRDKSFQDCVQFGCDRDYFPKLYLMSGFEQEECQLIDASKHSYRYAGGHLHIQNMSDNPDIYLDNLELAPIIYDFFVGTVNVLLRRDNKTISNELKRLKYYGRPGRVRIQKYSEKINGIEYRPLSNHWLSNIYHINSILSAANIASNIIEKERSQDFFYTFQDKIPDLWKALTTYNIEMANNLLVNSLTWSLENNFSTLKEMENVYEQLQ